MKTAIAWLVFQIACTTVAVHTGVLGGWWLVLGGFGIGIWLGNVVNEYVDGLREGRR